MAGPPSFQLAILMMFFAHHVERRLRVAGAPSGDLDRLFWEPGRRKVSAQVSECRTPRTKSKECLAPERRRKRASASSAASAAAPNVHMENR